MISFLSLAHYSAPLVILLGLMTFAGVSGWGMAFIRWLRLDLPTPWRQVTAILGGQILFQTAVQWMAMAGLARPGVLIFFWIILTGGGTGLLFRRWRVFFYRRNIISFSPADLPVFIPAALAALTNLLLAAAPSTKIDEIYYHMLVPARVVTDKALIFYRGPWITAVQSQMGFQMAGSPLYALGYPDSPNILSWCLGMSLAWFIGYLVGKSTNRRWGLFAAAVCVIGLYPSVWHTTGGAHALGDFASAAVVAAVLFHDTLLPVLRGPRYLGFLSILAVTAATTKITLLPIMAVVLLAGGIFALRTARDFKEKSLIFVGAALPWVVFYVPLLLWTFLHTGSPFGLFLAGWLGNSSFARAARKTLALAQTSRRTGLLPTLWRSLISLSPLVWVGLAASPFLPRQALAKRALAAGLFGLQLALIIYALPHDFRFLAGLPFALMAYSFVAGYPLLSRFINRRFIVRLAAVILLLPWLGAQIYRAVPLIGVSVGLESPRNYAQRYIPLYDDFVRLDKVLPQEAVFYTNTRIGSVYASRPIYYDLKDVPSGRRIFALVINGIIRVPEGCSLDPAIYENRKASLLKFRTPGLESEQAVLQVREVKDCPLNRKAPGPFR